MDFYTVTTISAILLLIIALTTIGVVISNSISTEEFPKFHNPCPDYWTYHSSSDTGHFCVSNGKNIPNNNVPTRFAIKNSTKSYADQLQNNCNFAQINTLLWDGVSNYNGCKRVGTDYTLSP